MNLEDFPDKNQPEMPSNPEVIEPPSQETLRHLLYIINSVTLDKEIPGLIDTKGVDLHYPGNNIYTATVWSTMHGAALDYPAHLAQIHQQGRVDSNGNQLFTKHFISKAPGGMQIEKHVFTINSHEQKKKLGPNPSLNAIYGSLMTEPADSITYMKESQTEENKGVVSSVSEQETRDLITLLEELEP